jgi:small-conductance mechanosensitive channel
MDRLIEWLQALEPWEMLAYSAGAALVLQLVVTRVLLRITRVTQTGVDDEIVQALRTPVFVTILLLGLYFSVRRYVRVEYPDAWTGTLALGLRGTLLTIGIWVWAKALGRASDTVLEALARRADDFAWIQPRSLPLYEIVAKLLVVGGAIYAVMLAWDVDVTAWLASAGILGIAVGFAAKDTLANLFAGIFILTDAPYKLGDYIVVESGERGMVTDIGIRSTRILTRDDIEITIPNSVMANSKITNESSGRHVKRRIRATVGVAYGSDIGRARAVLMDAARACGHAASTPEPRVRFRELGDSALVFQVLMWVEHPESRGRALDALNTEIHDRLQAAGIEIPFPQRVVHLQQPA